jgi:hypothetical protein
MKKGDRKALYTARAREDLKEWQESALAPA